MNVWTSGSSFSVPRAEYGAINLADGRILISGGRQAGPGPTVTSCDIYDPADGSCVPTGSMITQRRDHALVLLDDNTVLAIGGENGTGAGTVLASCEIYDPVTETWSAAQSLSVGRSQFATWKLPNGKVLVAGGFTAPTAATAVTEIYDPTLDIWTSSAPFNPLAPRGSISFTTMADGYPFATVGLNDYAGLVGYTETWKYIWDDITPYWVSLADYPITMFPDVSNNAVLMDDGKILVIGGFAGALNDATAECYLYDPDLDTWTATGDLNQARWDGYFWKLPNGDIMVAGGTTRADWQYSTEVLDHTTLLWTTQSYSTNFAHHISNASGITNIFAGDNPWMGGGVTGPEPGYFIGTTETLITEVTPPMSTYYSLVFNGSGGGVTFPNFADNLTNFSVSCWVKTSSTTGVPGLVTKTTNISTNAGWYLAGGTSGVLQCYAQQDGSNYRGSTTSTNIHDDTWHHVVMTKSGTSVLIYIDKVSVGTPDSAGTLTTFSNATNVVLGVAAAILDGKMASISIFNVALSQGDVDNLFLNINPLPANTLSWWKLTEGSGTSVADSSGNGQNSTAFNGAVTWSSDIPSWPPEFSNKQRASSSMIF